jgi:hypothetical protein
MKIPTVKRRNKKRTASKRPVVKRISLRRQQQTQIDRCKRDAAVHVEKFRISLIQQLRKLNVCQRHLHNKYGMNCNCRIDTTDQPKCRFDEQGNINHLPFASASQHIQFNQQLNNLFDRYLHTHLGMKCACGSNNSKTPKQCKFNSNGILL